MKLIRVWIVLFALVSFVAGTATGHIITERSHQEISERQLSDYEQHFAETFQLAPVRVEHLRTVLVQYEREVERIKDEHLLLYRSNMDGQLRALSEEYNRYLRDKVLPPQQRAEFDARCSLLTL